MFVGTGMLLVPPKGGSSEEVSVGLITAVLSAIFRLAMNCWIAKAIFFPLSPSNCERLSLLKSIEISTSTWRCLWT